mgnify:FL=1
MNPREIALKIINDVNTNSAYANISLDRELKKHDLVSDQDRRFITELVYGTVKAGKTIDWILGKYLSRPLKKVSPIIQDILRMGIYQIFFMSKIPPSAACNQAVELAKKYGHQGTVKFVNGVLRNAVRSPEKAQFPDRNTDPELFLALTYFHPQWLIKRWIKKLGFTDTEKLCIFNNSAPPLCLRTNTLKQTRAELLKILATEEMEVVASTVVPEGIICLKHPNLSSLESLKQGLFQIQDESSMLVAHIVAPTENDIIIDACSAPGGKTTHMATLMNNTGKIIATDIYQHKLDKIKENATKLGLTNIEPTLLDAKLLHTQYQNFADKVLVDAPCSGLGVIRRKPDSRWRKEEELIKELPTLQQEILNSAAKCVKPGGVLVYSTCTTEEEENQTVIYQFLQDNKNFRLEVTGQFLPITKTTQELIQIWPHNDKMDGFFIARMKRNN